MITGMDIFKKLRLSNKESQKDIANILGVSDSYISKIEKNNNKNQYSIPQIQLLMKHFDINLIKISCGELEVVNKHYASVLNEDFNKDDYLIENNLNDLITSMREYKNLTKTSFADLINFSLNTVSSWERHDRVIDILTFESILRKCEFIDIYITQDSILLKKPYIDTKLEDSELYKLAKISCKYLDKTRKNSYILGDISLDYKYRPYQVYYAKTELESALKMIDTCQDSYLDDLIGLNYLPKDSTIDDVYRKFYQNPKLCETIDSNSANSHSYKYEGEGLYIRFGDGGYNACKLSSLLKDVYSENFYEDNISEDFDNDESENNALVDKLYYNLVCSVY